MLNRKVVQISPDTEKALSTSEDENVVAGMSALVYSGIEKTKEVLEKVGCRLMIFGRGKVSGNQFFVASQNINDDQTRYIVAVRGMDQLIGWGLRNIDVRISKVRKVEGNVHHGFGDLAEDVFAAIPKRIVTDVKAGVAKVLVTGHSLGGTASNVVAAMLYEEGV